MSVRRIEDHRPLLARLRELASQSELTASIADVSRSKVWVCGACGRQNADRMQVGDESCYLNSVLVYEDTIVRKGQMGQLGFSLHATAVPNGGGQGQGNGTAGRKFYPCWACGGHPLKCGGGSMCARKQGLA